MSFVDDATLVETIGKGGQGTVHLMKAQDGRLFVLKSRSETSDKSRFRAAYEAHKRLDGHDAFQRVYEGDEEILALEYIEGPTLELYRGMLSWAGTVPILRSLCDAVLLLQSEGMIHRDLKPDNLLLANGRLVVIDLGSVDIGWGLTRGEAGPVPHTPGFASPELTSGAPVTPAENVFQIASIANYLLSDIEQVPEPSRTLLKRGLETPLSRPAVAELKSALSNEVTITPNKSGGTLPLTLGVTLGSAVTAAILLIPRLVPLSWPASAADPVAATSSARAPEPVSSANSDPREDHRPPGDGNEEPAETSPPEILQPITVSTAKPGPAPAPRQLTHEEKKAKRDAERQARARRALEDIGAISPKNP